MAQLAKVEFHYPQKVRTTPFKVIDGVTLTFSRSSYPGALPSFQRPFLLSLDPKAARRIIQTFRNHRLELV